MIIHTYHAVFMAKDFFGKNNINVYGMTVLGERGQIVIPKEARKKLKLKNGDQFLVGEHLGKIILVPQGIMRELLSILNKHLS
jgi:AbrB family looped-hinge helix DNA binding protein